MKLFGKTATRVNENTRPEVNELIQYETTRNIERYAMAKREDIERRIIELDREWDIERAIEAHAAAVALAGMLFGTFKHRRWFALTGLAIAFLLQHALQGWYPVLFAMRRFGFRTQREIDDERTALIGILDSKIKP